MGKLETKMKAFDYMIYRMVDWSMDLNNEKNEYNGYRRFNSLEDFNLKNDFSFLKLELFPFFLLMASNDREKFLDIFDNFEAGKIGMVEGDISKVFEGRYENEFIKINHFESKIKEPFQSAFRLRDYNMGDYFENLSSREIIDNSFKLLKSKGDKMINYDVNNLIFYSCRHSIWSAFYFQKSLGQKVDRDLLLREKSIFSNKKETFSFI